MGTQPIHVLGICQQVPCPANGLVAARVASQRLADLRVGRVGAFTTGFDRWAGQGERRSQFAGDG